ncbi:hypothetical protein ISN44_As09g011780 [Arabidopsis suecica]|uniref:Uncharacterized protein n=1 Tax=Arabidopsis suecica TaxID=45249 RepID=A0A8T2AFS0_ARASU|nr:hypothetical protein ISN44_As09g011780 [Arabidopsis suecica]
MEQEEPCEAKETASLIEPKTPNPNVPDSVPAIDSDSSLSEEEIITEKDRGIVTLSPLCIDSVSVSDCVLVSDEEILESIYQNLLRFMVSASSTEIWCFDGCKTPPPSSRNLDSNMASDTCPGAPMKLTKIARNIDSGLRRKLF